MNEKFVNLKSGATVNGYVVLIHNDTALTSSFPMKQFLCEIATRGLSKLFSPIRNQLVLLMKNIWRDTEMPTFGYHFASHVCVFQPHKNNLADKIAYYLIYWGTIYKISTIGCFTLDSWSMLADYIASVSKPSTATEERKLHCCLKITWRLP